MRLPNLSSGAKRTTSRVSIHAGVVSVQDNHNPEIAQNFSAIEAQAARSLSSGVSCSSKDGSQDCFCPGGCRRTQTSCDCTANISAGVSDALLMAPGF